MALASSNLAQLRYFPEAVFGTPVLTGTPNNLRMTGESLAYAITTAVSNEIRADRMVSDLILTGANANGANNLEMSFKEYDDLIEAVTQGTWLGCNDSAIATATITLTNTITAGAGTPFSGVQVGQPVKFTGFANAANNVPLTVLTVTDTVITVAGTPLVNEAAAVTFNSYGKLGGGAHALTLTTSAGTTLTASAGAPFANVVAGQYVLLSGMVTAANSGLKKVVSKTSSTVLVFAAATFAANEANTAATFSASRVTNGTTQRSFTLERSLQDVGQSFRFDGMTVSKMSMSFASGAVVTGSFDFMGKSARRADVTGPNFSQFTGTPVPSDTYDVMNAVTGVGNVLENGITLAGTFIKTLKFDLDNALRAQDAIGVFGAAGIASGSCMVKGDIEVYLANGTMYDKFINNTASTISWTMQDGAGNGYAFTLPKVKYSDAKVQAGGLNQDIIISMPFTALLDPTTAKMVLIDRFGA